MKKQVLFLIGPTGVGKTTVSISLAKRINAEIICCDSMQVYKEMNIMTSKPPLGLMKQIPHHLFDIRDPDQNFSAAEFEKEALRVISDIHKKGKIPLFVGGTGFYVTALVDGLFKAPGANWQIRSQLSQEAKDYGNEALFERLKALDSETANKLHSNDLRRIIRALEIWHVTGFKISDLKRSTKGIYSDYDIRFLGLIADRKRLYEKVEQRVDEMFEHGLVDEVRAIRNKYKLLSLTSSQALGYKEVVWFLDEKYTLDETRDLLKKNTRRYAKRQLSWFRRDKRIRWINIEEIDSMEAITEKLIKER